MLEPETTTVEPGQVALLSLTVRNVGNLVESCSVVVLGVPSNWVTVDRHTVHLDLDQSETVRIELRPPRLPSTPPGIVPFHVVVASNVERSVRADKSGTLAVGAFSDVVAQVIVPESESRRVGLHRVLIANQGNSTIRPRVIAQDRAAQLRFATRPPIVELPPGGDVAIDLLAIPRKRLLFGQPYRHSFTVAVDGNRQPPAQAVFTQLTVAPRWTMRLVMALFVAALSIGVPVGIIKWKDRQATAARNAPVEVPVVEKLTRLEALDAIRQTGLSVRIEEDTGFPEGQAKSTDPPPLSKVAPGSQIVLIVGTAKPQVEVRSVVTLSFPDAQAELERSGFIALRSTQTSTEGVRGTVVRQDPAGGKAERGSSVQLVVSNGPGTVTVPVLLSLTESQARDELTKAGFTTRPLTAKGKIFTVSVPKDTVAAVSLEPGAEVEKTSLVQLTLSNGPPLKPVPTKLTNIPLEAARSALIGAGFQVDPAVTMVRTTTVDAIGKVLEANASGVENGQAPEGTVFQLVVGQGDGKVLVPKVTGAKEANAAVTLVKEQLSFRNAIRRSSSLVAPGIVIGTQPAEATSQPEGTAVDLIVSDGPAVLVPKVTGVPISKAKADLAAEELSVSVPAFCKETDNTLTQTQLGESVLRGTVIEMTCSSQLAIPSSIRDNLKPIVTLTPPRVAPSAIKK